MDLRNTFAPVGKLPTYRYIISLVGKNGRNIYHLYLVTLFLNRKVDEDDIFMILPDDSPAGLNAPEIVVRLKNTFYSLKHGPRFCHKSIC
jgi:hypothetical protein